MDKERLIELYNQLKTKLVEKNKERYIIDIMYKSIIFKDVEKDTLNKIWDKSVEIDDIDTETRLVDYDCGGYDRALQLSGLMLENDKLYFYLIETEDSYEGTEKVNDYKEDLEGLLDERAWWMAGGDPVVEFRPDEVFEFYLDLMDEFEPIVI